MLTLRTKNYDSIVIISISLDTMVPVVVEEIDSEVTLLADIRAHDRVPNIEDVMDLSTEEHNINIASSIGATQPNMKRQREKGVVSLLPALPIKIPLISSIAVSTEASECQVCLETYTAGGDRRCVVTRCGHIFCFYCIDKIRISGQPCPKCRKKLGGKNNNPFVTIFDTSITIADTTLVDEERTKRLKVNDGDM